MRPVHLTDLDAAVRALLHLAEADWPLMAADVVKTTQAADKYRKRTRKTHPTFGNGSLSSTVSRQVKAPVQSCDARYRRCLAVLLGALG